MGWQFLLLLHLYRKGASVSSSAQRKPNKQLSHGSYTVA